MQDTKVRCSISGILFAAYQSNSRSAVAFGRRWSAARILADSQMTGFPLVLLGIVRAWDNFDTAKLFAWPVVVGMAVYLFVIIGIYIYIEGR